MQQTLEEMAADEAEVALSRHLPSKFQLFVAWPLGIGAATGIGAWAKGGVPSWWQGAAIGMSGTMFVVALVNTFRRRRRAV